ncbi:unnamed protein product [Sphenostylis stenocarpa]|uniref:Uncharacterized protein n=1 Tax=Sphenostylis stenocarpa TaxID=92480 RepID=A0AA86VRW6_9FABA|nr:unnamed protein product [Sphenostylis stenocarpa]
MLVLGGRDGYSGDDLIREWGLSHLNTETWNWMKYCRTAGHYKLNKAGVTVRLKET